MVRHVYDQHESYEKRVEAETGANTEAILDPEQDTVLTAEELDEDTLKAKERRESGLYLSPDDRFVAEDSEEEETTTDQEMSADGGFKYGNVSSGTNVTELLEQPPSEVAVNPVYSREEYEIKQHLDNSHELTG